LSVSATKVAATSGLKSSLFLTLKPHLMAYQIRPMLPQDWQTVAHIYEEGIATGNATFQKDIPTWEEWDGSHLKKCRFIAQDTEGGILGWAALTPVSGRCVYAGVAEVSVYVSPQYHRQGVGKMLMQHLIDSSESDGFWTLQAGIFKENIGSVRLHESVGFRIIGLREKIGQLDGVWRDTLLLERRSEKVGL
jgi:L-amino acid N-acyltransferase YncA